MEPIPETGELYEVFGTEVANVTTGAKAPEQALDGRPEGGRRDHAESRILQLENPKDSSRRLGSEMVRSADHLR